MTQDIGVGYKYGFTRHDCRSEEYAIAASIRFDIMCCIELK